MHRQITRGVVAVLGETQERRNCFQRLFLNHARSEVVVHHRGVLKRQVLLSFLCTENGQRIFFRVEGWERGLGFSLTSVARRFFYASTYRASENQAILSGDEKNIDDPSEPSSDWTLAYFAFSAESVTLNICKCRFC